MTNQTPTTNTPLTDVVFATLTVLFARGLCLGRNYSVGVTHQATGETRLEVLNLQGTPFFTFETSDEVFEAARCFAELEAKVPLGVGDDTTPQYDPNHPDFPGRS
jgi:hypothetical protein